MRDFCCASLADVGTSDVGVGVRCSALLSNEKYGAFTTISQRDTHMPVFAEAFVFKFKHYPQTVSFTVFDKAAGCTPKALGGVQVKIPEGLPLMYAPGVPHAPGKYNVCNPYQPLVLFPANSGELFAGIGLALLAEGGGEEAKDAAVDTLGSAAVG